MAATVRAAAGAVVVAAAFAAWAAWSWVTAAGDPAVTAARARDEALRAGTEHVAVLSSLDHRRVDEGIARWLAVSTGPLREKLAATSEETKRALRADRTVATATVLDAGVGELGPRGDSATLLASVETSLAREGQPPASTRNRFLVRMQRTDAGWRVRELERIPVAGGTP
ncbi:Mce-associated membrane protein [Amycolatopsis arida]|uniref:Mce-associated membrane protein n=1 Tax=Amycolatopsis arida TaxID=587909 RepID=A0A1I5K6K0_9PSEU|nr:hypothetical protein [Amycolatopsis arida]TDX96906.1 Mce-associated membrane protein [Amycolatopsis arida]SFO80598.1 Mce-associated membrane protein [Amycolatopsis arida]